MRRVLRIWMPYAVATAVAMVLAVQFYGQPIPAYSAWANQPQRWPTLTEALQHFSLVTSFSNGTYNPVVWSLVHEMRISILFPVLIWLVRKVSWRRVLLVAFGLSWLGCGVQWGFNRTGFPNDYGLTIHYCGLFFVGILLSQHWMKLSGWWRERPGWLWWGAGAAALACYTHPNWLIWQGKNLHWTPIRDWLIAVGVVAFIVLALGESRFSRLLLSRPAVFVGRISYSIYLYHAIILLTLAHSLYGRLPLYGIWALTWVATFVIAYLAFITVESYSIRLGHRFSIRGFGRVAPMKALRHCEKMS